MIGHDKQIRTMTAWMLLLFIGAMVVINILTTDKAFSEAENRVLEGRPAFELRSLISGTFTTNYERYVSDQFAFRGVWVGIKTDADRLVGKKDSNGVYLGEDGYLFQQFTLPNAAEVEERSAAIHSFHRATQGLNKYVMLVPTSAALLADKLPANAQIGDERAAINQVRELLRSDIRFVEVYPALHDRREESIYYKTDHHWTSTGAYYGYQALCRRMGIVPNSEAEFDIRLATDKFYGSLYSKSGFRHLQPDRIDLYLPREENQIKVEYVDEGRTTNSLYELEQLNKKDKYAVFLNGNHPLIRITTANPNGKRLLVVKDSYANSLIPFLAEHFAEIDVVDLRYYDESLLKLVQDRQFQDMVILYNVHTFFEDISILNLSEVAK
ncbi:DHHW family protein [Paenibacillus fonticola]|uniref:DHHW family protein n=1 Tax=Paenibacillus fonticola TaxID=379896 RepID=UPI0003713542|nr:DHHW family protein [Paenibacillus fonticola]